MIRLLLVYSGSAATLPQYAAEALTTKVTKTATSDGCLVASVPKDAASESMLQVDGLEVYETGEGCRWETPRQALNDLGLVLLDELG